MNDGFEIVALQFCSAESRDSNFLRGGFGKALRAIDREMYDRLFAPKLAGGPSGLKNAPRPFVLRVREDGFAFHLFDPRENTDTIKQAFRSFVGVGEIERQDKLFRFAAGAARRVRIRFKSPTELKGGDRPEFGVLFARIRDRISTLRALYQGGPLEIDFRVARERAGHVQMTRCEIRDVEAERTSRSTGQTHSLGGFVGVAEYEGDLGEFVPFLEIAKWTGVGRQTVWGKGEIDYEAF